MKKLLVALISLMTVLAFTACDPDTEAPVATRPDADMIIEKASISASIINDALNEEDVDSVLFIGTINVDSDEHLTIPEGKTLYGLSHEASIIEGSYACGQDHGNLVEVKGTLDGATIRLDMNESFDNWNNPEIEGATGTYTRNQNVYVAGGTLKNCAVYNGRNGVYLHSNHSDGAVVEGNNIYHNRTGIQVAFGADFDGELIIKSNKVHENETIGILIQELNTANINEPKATVTVDKNSFHGNWYSDIEIREWKVDGDTGFVILEGDDVANPKDDQGKDSGEHSSNSRAKFFNGGTYEKNTDVQNKGVIKTNGNQQ